MASTFYLEIITPERKFFSGDIEMVVLKTLEGEIGILKGHAPMVIAVGIGPMRIKKDGEWFEAFLSDGFMEIKQDATVILADTAEWPDEIDVERARAAKERAEERLQRQKDNLETMRSQAALARAIGRLKTTKVLK